MSLSPLRNMTLLTAVVLLCFDATTVVHGQEVQVTPPPVGDPIWSNTDFHLFSAPANSFEAFIGVLDSIWPLHGADDEYVPHDPPYDTETADNLPASGFQDDSIFRVDEIRGDPLGVYFTWASIPNPGAPTGSSRDFASGPIIPGNLAPITYSGSLLHGGQVVDATGDFDSSVPVEDGVSHVVSVFGTAAFFFPEGTELLGDYEIRMTARDAMGNGYDHTLAFQVVPEPSSAILSLVGGLLMLPRRRKRA